MANQQQAVFIPGPAPAQQPIIIQVVKQSAGCSRTYERYKAKLAAILASLQLFLGALSIAMNSAAFSVGASYTHHISYGIWSPVLWFVAGAFGIASACSKTQCTIITTMVMSIISAVTIVYYLPLACQGLDDDRHNKYDYEYGKYKCTDYTDEFGNTRQDCTWEYFVIPVKSIQANWTKWIAFGSMLVIVAVAEAIVAIIASALCCKVLCCGAPNEGQSGTVQYVPVNTVGAQGAPIQSAGATSSTFQDDAPEIQKRPLAEPAVESAPDYSSHQDQPPPYQSL